MTGVICPSYRAGFASPQRNRGRLKYPQLWRGCVGAWAPCLGPTGLRLYDQSGRGNHGTLTNMAAGSSFVPNSGYISMACTGADDVVLMPSGFNFDSLSSFSCCGWLYPTTITSGLFNTVVGQRASAVSYEWSLRVGAGSVVSFLPTSGGSINGTTTIAANTLYHMAATFVAGVVTVYLNGRPEASGASRTITRGSTRTSIGGWENSDANGYAAGYLNDIYVHAPALTGDKLLLLAKRPGIAYEMTRTRSYKAAAAGGFKAAWAAGRQNRIIGGGLR